ncbi:MAG: LL-diaminopimelate aminotransferase [Parachlamydiales bacterium]|nr:LL-diaminopimelate aminotransferase [Parachlamydiales bacterium]
MVKTNPHFQQLDADYFFFNIEKRIASQKELYPKEHFLNLGIGDVSKPLVSSVSQAIALAAQEMSCKTTMQGYGPSQGYSFLKQAIKDHEYKTLPITPEEIFISSGTKNDTANILDIFSPKSRIALANPTYPVYRDTTVMSGRGGIKRNNGNYTRIVYLNCSEKNGFKPPFPQKPVDLVYLCSPNNPTGTALTFEECQQWVDFAQKHRIVLLFDSAYEAFITAHNVPHSIFEVPGADEVAIEFKSFSKSAGFTGLRCSYMIIPQKLRSEEGHSLWELWTRRQSTKYGGTSYPIQKGALATYTEQGQKEIREILTYYKQNASLLQEGLGSLGFKTYGGVNAPYIWVKAPKKLSSWSFFDILLEKTRIVAIPGSGFGSMGEGYMRFSAFADREAIQKALERLKDLKL